MSNSIAGSLWAKVASSGRNTGPKRRLCLPVLLLGWVGLVDSLFGQGQFLMVTNLDDTGPGSLRNRIGIAPAGATISFAVRGTIVLTNGELLIGKNLRIVGPGAASLAVSAARHSRVLEIRPGAALLLSGLTICDGHAADGAAGTSNNPAGHAGTDGGGIYNAGSLNVAQCVISNCAAGAGGAGFQTNAYGSSDATNWVGGAGGRGGAIFNAGRLALFGSTFISNSSGAGGNAGGTMHFGAAGSPGGGGGAVYNMGSLTLADCSFEQNAAGTGGAAYNRYVFFMTTPVDGGHPGGAGGRGGAICQAGGAAIVLANCQFNSNISGAGGIGSSDNQMYSGTAIGGPGGSGGGGGALWTQGSVRMSDCTFVNNQTGPGGAGGGGRNTGGTGGLGGPGGAICAFNVLWLNNCLCASNQTGIGGAGGPSYAGSAGSGQSGGPGGAVYAKGTLLMTECTFSNNRTGPGGQGASASDSNTDLQLAPGDGGAGGAGGAVYSQSDTTANHSTFSRNQAGDGGRPGAAGVNWSFNVQPTTSGSDGGQAGAIWAAGALVLDGCTLSSNSGGNGTSADFSRYVAATLSSTAPAQASPMAGPHPNLIIYTWYGGPGGTGGTGGIYCLNRLRMVLCTIEGNRGGEGGLGGYSGGGYMQYIPGGAGGSGGVGGICSVASNEVDFVACTISGNHGGVGGRGGNGAAVPDLSGRTGQGSGGSGGAGGILNLSNVAPASLINTIVASNTGGLGGAGGPYRSSSGAPGASDLQGSFTSSGHNLIGRTDGSLGFTNGVNGDLAGPAIDPILGPLADNGGPTATMALLHGSPAVDAGDDAVLQWPYLLSTDQRGFPRKSGAHVDIGAFEFQVRPGDAPILSPDLSSRGLNPASPSSGAPAAAPGFRFSFSDNAPGATFTVLATTNLSLPLHQWSILGQPVRIAPGSFQFIDFHATNTPFRFYRLSSP